MSDYYYPAAQVSSEAKYPANAHYYSAKLTSQMMFCDVRINGFSILDNARVIKGKAKASFSILGFLTNGPNEIVLEVASWNALDKETQNLSAEEKQRFSDPDAFCTLEILRASSADREAEKETVALIKGIVVPEQVDKDNGRFRLSIDPESSSSNIDRASAEMVSMNAMTRTNGLPAERYRLARILEVDHIPSWRWSHAPTFHSIPDGRKLLEEAYYDLWNVFNTKDARQLRARLSVSLDELIMANMKTDEVTDDERDFYFEELGYADLFEQGFEMLPFEPHKFKIETFADGRVVRLTRTGHQSPICYADLKTKKVKCANHYFALINGKFIIVR